MPAISKHDPRYYVKQMPLQVSSQKGVKIQARSDKVYNPMMPTRDDIRKDNYKRRFRQMNEQGFHAANHKPYQGIGDPFYLDKKKLILHALGQWDEQKDMDSSSSSDSDDEAALIKLKQQQLQQQKAFTTTNFFVRRTRKDLNTLPKETNHGRELIRNVHLGHGLFYMLRRERQQKVITQQRELRKKREQQKNEWQPPKRDSSSSEEDDSDEDLQEDIDLKLYLPSDDSPPTDKEVFITEVVPPSPDMTISIAAAETPAPADKDPGTRVAFQGVENTSNADIAATKSVRSMKSVQTMGTSSRPLSSKKSAKTLPPRPYTPQRSNINTDMDYVIDKNALFRQLCALYWLLEAMNVDNPNTMAPISTCWSMNFYRFFTRAWEIGGSKGKDRKQEKDKLDSTWNRFVTRQNALKVPRSSRFDHSRPWRLHGSKTHHMTSFLSHLHSKKISHMTHQHSNSGHVTPQGSSHMSPHHSGHVTPHHSGHVTPHVIPSTPTRSVSPANSHTSHEESEEPVTTLMAVANGKRSGRLGKTGRKYGGYQSLRHRNSSVSVSRTNTPTGSQQQLNDSLNITGGVGPIPPHIRVEPIPEGQRSGGQHSDTGKESDEEDDRQYTRGLFRFLDEYYDSLRKDDDDYPDDKNSTAEVASSHSARSDRKGRPHSDSDRGGKSRVPSATVTSQASYSPEVEIPEYEDLTEQQFTTILEGIERSFLDPRLHKLANPTERRTEKAMRADINVRPKSSPAVLEFKNNLPSATKQHLCHKLQQQFSEAYQNKALILHDTLEALERERMKKVQNKFMHLPTERSSFQRAVRTMRHKTIKEEENLRESQRKQSLYQQWFTDLDSNIPEHLKQDWYFNRILNKLQKYGLVEANKQSQYKFLMVLTSLRDWEICSPDISASIEFCRERIVEMPVEEYEEWFHQQFPKVIRPQTAPAAIKREDREKRELESAKKHQAIESGSSHRANRVAASAPPGGRKQIK